MTLDPVVLMRASLAEEDELRTARKYLPVYETRAYVPQNSLVIGRYSVLPYYKELEDDLAFHGSKLINSLRQHSYVADMKQWYGDLKDMTPRTFFSMEEFKRSIASGDAKSYVLKGQTNSKKHQWNTHMYAPTAKDVDDVYRRLCDDSLIGDQEIYIREYVPLRTFGEGIRGLPITEEYRFFVLDGHIVGSGWYWSQFPEVREENNLGPWMVDQRFLREAISAVAQSIRFFVIDVARKADGGWMVVELNDGCMSGLSEVDPTVLYSNLQQRLTPLTPEQRLNFIKER